MIGSDCVSDKCQIHRVLTNPMQLRASFSFETPSSSKTQNTAPGCAGRQAHKYTVHSDDLTLPDLVGELKHEVKVKRDYRLSSGITPCYM